VSILQVWTAAINDADERDKSWQMAEQLLCALEGKADADCATTKTPTVNAFVLVNGVAKMQCHGETNYKQEPSTPAAKKCGVDPIAGKLNQRNCQRGGGALQPHILDFEVAEKVLFQ
jgi:hypothetical protein